MRENLSRMDCFVRPFVTYSTHRSLRLFQCALKTASSTLAYTKRRPWRQSWLRASFQSNTYKNSVDPIPAFNNVAVAEESAQMDVRNKVLLKGLTLEKMQLWLESLGEKRFRALQLWKWLYQQQGGGVDNFASMTNLSKQFREKLEQVAVVDSLKLENVYEAQDGTKKLTFRLKNRDSGLGGGVVESVLIPNESWVTLCVSSQLGCAQRCQFCYTAKMGLHGHLHTAEIVDQVVIAKRLFEKEKRISNVVFMGMGEPLHNIDNVLTAIEILLDEQGLHLSHNKVTVSTSGLVPEMERLTKETKVNLALSLNATTDEVRDKLMPINRKYPIQVLLDTVKRIYTHERSKQKLFVEYVMLNGVNDSLEDAKRLHILLAGIPCKINLIPFNSHEGADFESSSEGKIQLFYNYLTQRGHYVFTRESRGQDKMAACGQLGKPRRLSLTKNKYDSQPL
ncbi:hypothetical protein GpartN1_g3027.t1 [Galdieria partita]|uniref:Radical SAM core domain-containing protein n=1 Tax=Galdieria partita TaxID=83374 RepID=A0A9C7PWS9_9RHOD|nr:hypothetical protein GpartN1_g3027.t1 [Galdieria partita]